MTDEQHRDSVGRTTRRGPDSEARIARQKLMEAARKQPQGVHHVDIAADAESLTDDGADVFAALARKQQGRVA